MFRLWFLTFWGQYRGPNPATGGHRHDTDAQDAGHAGAAHTAQDTHAADSKHGHGAPHESPRVMVVPLIILAVLSLVGGWVGVPKVLGGSDRFGHFLEPVFTAYAPVSTGESMTAEHESSGTEWALMGVSVGVALFGLFGAWYLYVKRTDLPDKMAASAGGLYRLILDKYRIDELYGAVFIQPIIALSTSVFWKGVDRGLIDAAVNGGAAGANEASDVMRRMQSGNIRSYAGWVAVGAAAVIAFMVWRGVQ